MRSLIGQDKPDCYVIVSVGAEEYRFAKIKRSSSTFPTKKSFHCQDSREEGHVRPRLVRRGGVVKFKLIYQFISRRSTLASPPHTGSSSPLRPCAGTACACAPSTTTRSAGTSSWGGRRSIWKKKVFSQERRWPGS